MCIYTTQYFFSDLVPRVAIFCKKLDSIGNFLFFEQIIQCNGLSNQCIKICIAYKVPGYVHA